MSITETSVPPLPQVLAGLEKPIPTLTTEGQELKQRSAFIARSPLQTIADGLKRLVWDDAEKIAALICSHLQSPDDIKARMAAALQRAADDLIKEDHESRQ